MPRLLDARGAPVTLGRELGRGGEGAVHAVAGAADLAAKLYLRPPSRERAEKLTAMAGMASPRLLRLAAWPVSTLHDGRGAVLGFTMPRITGHRPVFQVYGPKLRLQQFPQADWRFLVHAAANAARAFGVVHAGSHVVGDVNHGNLLVAQDATVRFIDTDSFQVIQGGRRFACEVGVSTHQPPEMQGLADFRAVLRTPNHDAFGLAVMIFQLLCMGRHPFSGRFTGRGEPPDIEHAIAHSRYAYSREPARTQMVPGPDTLPVAALGAEVEALFEAAFAPAAARGGRPGADQWVAALERLGAGLRRCAVNAGHWHAPHGDCPWCRLEARGAAFFPVAFVPGPAGGESVAVLWGQIAALREPPPLPPLLPPDGRGCSPSPGMLAARRRLWRKRLVAAFWAACGVAAVLACVAPAQRPVPLLAVAGAALALALLPPPAARRDAAFHLRRARADWAALERQWRTLQAGPDFRATREALEAARRELEALPAERGRRLAALTADRRRSQFAQHLQSFSLAAAHVAGVGKSKVATLLSYGIDSAADIDAARIAAIPGFGPKTVASLVAYRQACETAFRFDPTRAVAQAEVAALDQDLGARRLRLEATLRSGLARLRGMAEERAARRRALEAQAGALRPVLAQALADARAVGA